MKDKTELAAHQNAPHEVTVTHHDHDQLTVEIKRYTRLCGTRQQLLTWLLDRAEVTKSELWLLHLTEPLTFAPNDAAAIWEPTLIITQRTHDAWTVAAFNHLVGMFSTVDLILFLTKLLPPDSLDKV